MSKMFSYLYGKFLHYRFLYACRIFKIIPKKRRLVSSYVKFDKLSENLIFFIIIISNHCVTIADFLR